MSTTTIHRIPGPLAIAIQAGRPELVRAGLPSYAGTMTPEQVQELGDWAEAIVRDCMEERLAIARMTLASEQVRAGALGFVGQVERLHEALQALQRGAPAQEIIDALTNPKYPKD